MTNIVEKVSVVALIFVVVGLAAKKLEAQGPGYIITDYGFNGEFGMAVLNVDGSNTYNVLPNTQASPPSGFAGGCGLDRTRTPLIPSMPQDGSVIAFESEGAPDRLHRVFLMNRDGTGPAQVTFTDPIFPTAADRFPAISPDGTKIAFRSTRTTDGTSQVFTVNQDGSGLRQVTFAGNVVGLAWSPDSAQLAYSGFSFPGFTCPFPNEGLKIINADGTGERFLACSRNGAGAAIDWSADSTRIAFVDAFGLSGRDGFGISQVAPDGTRVGVCDPSNPGVCDITPAQLGHSGDTGGLNSTDAGAFRYSPDGTTLAYFAWGSGSPQGISFINVDGTGRQDTIEDRNYHHIWWQLGPSILPTATLTLSPNPLVVGPDFPQQLSTVLKDSAGNILSRSALGYCTQDGRFAKPDQLGFVRSPFGSGPDTPMVAENGGLVSNVITAHVPGTDPPVSSYPATWDFGNQAVNSSSATQVFTVRNTGGAAVNFNAVTLIGVNAADFAFDPGSTCPLGGGGSLMPGDICTVGIIFSPSNTGTSTAQISVDDDASGSPQTIPLVGTGT